METNQYAASALDPLILYADNHLLAVNKQAGLLTQDSGTGQRNLEDWAREWVRVDKQKEGKVFLNAVHRIDRVVSGVVLFARTSKALTRLNEDIRKQQCRKVYRVWVEGTPEKSADCLVNWLKHEHQQSKLSREDVRGAQRAELSYQLVETKKAMSLLEVELKTGRYHQIRSQLAAMGCPIVGDVKYGAKKGSSRGTIALHHYCLSVTHPTTKERLMIKAEPPLDRLWCVA